MQSSEPGSEPLADPSRDGAAAASPAPSRAVAPRERGRVHALDVARGFALLGILLVNIGFFALPFVDIMEGEVPTCCTELSFWRLVKITAEGKFYPLFSMLFGIGLVLQRRRVMGAGGSFVPLYLRRLAILCVIGLIHGLLFWYGDILFVYSIAGLLLLSCSALSGRWLLALGSASMLVATVVVTGLVAIGTVMESAGQGAMGLDPSLEEVIDENEQADGGRGSEPESSAPPLEDNPMARLLENWQAGDTFDLRQMEISAYRDGGFLQAQLFRTGTFLLILITTLFGGGFHIVGLFFAGAGLFKIGLFDDAWRRRRRGIAAIGLSVGLVAAVVSVLALEWFGPTAGELVHQPLLLLFGPLLSLGYLCGAAVFVEWGGLVLLRTALQSAGRMALTVYLGQTLICTFLMYHWGLGWFGSTSAGERLIIVLSVYAVLVGFATLWLRRFRFGPMEWLWRWATYGRRPPMLRRSAARSTSAV